MQSAFRRIHFNLIGSRSMQCNICDGTKFLDFNGRVGIMCVSCKSVERTRLVWMYIERLGLHRDSRILHLAPERGIYDKLTKLVAPGNYDVRDIDPAKYPFAKGIRPLDLCSPNCSTRRGR